MFPHGKLHPLYYFSISGSTIYSPCMFSFPLWYYPAWRFSQLVCLPVCLSVCLYLLWTPTNDSPVSVSTDFFFLSSGLVFLHKLYLGQEIRQPKDDTDHPKKKQGNEAVLVLYEYIHMFECFWVPANLFFLPLTWLRCRSAQIKIGGLSLLVIFTNPCHHLSWSLD